MKQETGQKTGNKSKGRSWRGLKFVAGLLLFLVIVTALGWLFRTTLAEKALAGWCAGKNLSCAVNIEQLELGHIELADLVIESGTDRPLTVKQISSDLSWPNIFQPRIDHLRVDAPVLRAAFDGETLSYYGLLRLIPQSENTGSSVMPRMDATDGRIYVATPAGELAASVTLTGSLSDTGLAEIRIDPAELASDGNRLVWSEGNIRLEAIEGVMTGRADLDLEAVTLGALEIAGAELEVDIQDIANQAILVWSGSIDALRTSTGAASGLSFSGRAQPRLGIAGGYETILTELAVLSFEAEATSSTIAGTETGYAAIKTELTRKDDQLSGPVTASAEDVVAAFGTIKLATLSGDVSVDPAQGGIDRFAGAIVVKNAGVTSDRRKSFVAPVALPGLFSPHGEALQDALQHGLADFDTGADFVFEMREASWQLEASRASALRAASGLTLSIEPPDGVNWLTIRSDMIEMKGDFVITGGGAPTARIELDRLFRTLQELEVATQHVSLDQWSVDGRALELALDRLDIQMNQAGVRVNASGNLTVDGNIGGVIFQPTRITGGVEAVQGREGWRVQMLPGQTCLSFSTQGLRSGVVELLPVSAELCPDDGRFIHTENGHPTGSMALDDIAIPFRTNDSTGALELAGSSLNWSATDDLSMSFNAETLHMPVQFGERSLIIESQQASFNLRKGQGPLWIQTELGQTLYGGTMIPANVSSSTMVFNGTVGANGVDGHAVIDQVEIADINADPLYQPMLAKFTADFSDSIVHLAGPVRLKASGRTIADARMDMVLATLTGTASLESSRLMFTHMGLQPADISERLRGVLSNARGAMQASAQFTINQGVLAGTAEINVDALGVDTFRLGPVDGVSGTIVFSDILTLTTAPSQVLTIGSLNPGILLESGRLAFQLIGGREARLEEAVWPFAGGELIMEPTSWRVSGISDRIIVRAEKINLEELAGTLAIPDLHASGTVSGTFPIDIIGPNAFIRNASLKADESGGFLSYTGEVAEQAAETNSNVKLAFDALKNFEFSVLELGVDGNVGGSIDVRLLLVGSNQDVLGGAAFKFDIGVTSDLAQLIQSGQRTMSGQWVLDMIEKQISQPAEDADEQDNSSPFN